MSIGLVRLPSLDLLRGFVAVGRRLSITQAADDLCLTQSAVSRQIQTLEEALGVKLLVRGHRSLSFTPEGERLFRSADGAVQQLQDVVGSLAVARGRRPVTVTASIGVAALWLIPRLGQFQQRHPGIDVRVAANNRILDLKGEGVDLAIRYCDQAAAPAGAERLFGVVLAPVAHPALGNDLLASPEALSRQCLLEYDDPRRPWLQWSEWLGSLGWSGLKPRAVLRFNHYDQVIQAAVAGQGVALGRLELLGPLLADGRLQVLGNKQRQLPDEQAYWLVTAGGERRDEVRQVADWIRAEALAGEPPG